MSTNAAIRRSSSATAKRPAMAENAAGPKAAGPWATQAKKRVALGNITNVAAAGGGRAKLAAPPGTTKLNSATSTAPVKKGSLASARNVSSTRDSAVKSVSTKAAPAISRHDITTQRHTVPPPKVSNTFHVSNPVPALAPCSNFVSPGRSGDSDSIDETMSICDSMKSPDFEYIDNGDSMLASLQRQANEQLHISEVGNVEENKWMKNNLAPMEIDRFCDVDNADPQLCATLASDIYMHLREAETRKRPSSDFMETIQKDVNPSMRAILIDWLVEVAEEYRLVPDTLYLTVNYIDRYLSGNEINRQRLQLLGVACMLIAAKYEEICAPQVEEFCYITDNTYFRDENSTLAHYTQYKPSELCDCVKALHRLFSVGPGSNLPAIREKYSQHKYKCVAKNQCPPSIPIEFFQDVTC
ncbi:hypothetical protein PR202_gb27253 [Eleusine coracana subsp. coracana]|uniref:Cyclin N-terminal domain-containing protein n=1 Tax=Eleusine coracana subsp. coracana TaxID=191504 RepID=A0AAV5FUV5_ELECO|nr:hypothetical protein PR202_gb27253 [Eleusine coracana subsp. coracana]